MKLAEITFSGTKSAKASVEQAVKCAFMEIEKNAFKVFKMNSYLT